MSIGKTRGFLYWLARLMGDVRLIRQPQTPGRSPLGQGKAMLHRSWGNGN